MGRHGKMMRGRVPAAPQGTEWAAASPAKAAALRPYITAGVALVGASVIAVSPVTPSLPDLALEQPAVRLLAALDPEYSDEPGHQPGQYSVLRVAGLARICVRTRAGDKTGGVPGWIPPGAPTDIGRAVMGPYGPLTALHQRRDRQLVDGIHRRQHLGLGRRQLAAAGRDWHVYLPVRARLTHRPTTADFRAGRVHCGRARQLRVRVCRRAGLPGRLAHVPNAAYSAAFREQPSRTPLMLLILRSYPSKPVWANQPGAQLNPLGLAQVFADYLMQDPSDNPVILPNPGDVLRNGALLGLDYLNDYNPLVQGSFLYWGAPTLWSVPALLAGLVQNFTGIPNQFIGIGEWQGNADTGGGGIPSWGATAGPASLLTGVPAGLLYLAQGLLGYVDPAHTSGLAWGTPC